MQLRDYQDYGVEAVFHYFANGGRGNPILAYPTGTGKGPMIGGFCHRALIQYPQIRILKITHSQELIEQNAEKLKMIWPSAPCGIYSAGLGQKDIGYPITFAGIASLNKADLSRFGRFDFILVDECHLISPKEETMYRRVINYFLSINPYLKVIGLTATAYRLGQGKLTDGENPLFTEIIVDCTTREAFNWFIDQGYLCKLVPRRTDTKADLSGVRIKGGEFEEKSATLAFDKITYEAVQEMLREGADRKHWLIFASGVQHTESVAEMLNSVGIPTTFVHSKLKPKSEREKRIKAFKNGEFQAMVNNGILTTGFDYPSIDYIAMLRATLSPGLWVQMLGRGTRPLYSDGYDLNTQGGRLASIENSEKPNCLVSDFACNVVRLGPINDPIIPAPKGKKKPGDAPIKICESCACYNHASVRFCEFCGWEFPRHIKISAEAATAELIAPSNEPLVIEIFKVDHVEYGVYTKKGSVPALVAKYQCGIRTLKQHVCLEHNGYAKHRAHEWWRAHSPNPSEIPATALEALKLIDTLKTPTHLRVWVKKKYDEILDHDFTGSAFGGL